MEANNKGIREPRRAKVDGLRRNRISFKGLDPNYVYRVVNDVDNGDRVSRFREIGYEVVADDKIKAGDKRVNQPTPEGSPITISVGGGTKGILMRIPKEWYEEDQAEKNRAIDESEAAILHPDETYGQIKLERQGGTRR